MANTGTVLAILQARKNMPDSQVAGDAVTLRKLTRITQGEGDLRLSELRKILTNMGVSLRQFANFAERQTMNPSLLAEQVNVAREQQDETMLRELFLLAQRRGRTKQDKLGMVMAAASYEQMTGIRLMDETEEAAYTAELLRGASWTKAELLTFQVELHTMTPSHVFTLLREIMTDMDGRLAWNYALYVDSWLTVLRGLQSLIERHSSFAIAVLRQIDSMAAMPEPMLHNRLYLKGLRAIMTLTHGDDAAVRMTLQRTISYLSDLNAQTIAQQLTRVSRQVLGEDDE